MCLNNSVKLHILRYVSASSGGSVLLRSYLERIKAAIEKLKKNRTNMPEKGLMSLRPQSKFY